MSLEMHVSAGMVGLFVMMVGLFYISDARTSGNGASGTPLAMSTSGLLLPCIMENIVFCAQKCYI
eukprot:scaffold4260_cov99-Skeletonema_marinoi.AAC.1